MRLQESGHPPDLSLKVGMRYHLFLSHIWSSGQVSCLESCIAFAQLLPQKPLLPIPIIASSQDQVANIKRKLQLVLPGVVIFLGSKCAV